MSVLRKKTAPALALCSAILLLPQDCGPMLHVVYHFELPSCPEEAFSLPNSVEQAPYKLSDIGSKDESYRMCPGFTVYHLRENGKERLYYRVRLNRGQSCSIDVGYSYMSPGTVGPIGGGKPREDLERDLRPWVEAVAELVMQGSNVVPRVPAASMERLRSGEVEAWCARSSGRVERSCDGLHLARASDSSSVH